MASASCAKGLTLCHKFCTCRRRSFPTVVLRNSSFEEGHTEREREKGRKRKTTYPMMSALQDLKESSRLMTRQLYEEAPSTQAPTTTATTTTAAAASRERKNGLLQGGLQGFRARRLGSVQTYLRILGSVQTYLRLHQVRRLLSKVGVQGTAT
jgi:hypothetical protein